MDLEAIGKPILCHEGRLSGKGTRGHTTFNINDYVTNTQVHFTVLQRSVIVAPYVKMHVQMLRHFGNWLCVQMLDKDVGVELVDKNLDDIVLL
jgi:hypothetical protein